MTEAPPGPVGPKPGPLRPHPDAGTRARVSWVLYDWANQPFFTLITTFVFAPYFATQVAQTPAQGQALWGIATGAAGLIIAFMSPVLGAIADVTGERKRWIAAFSVLFVLGSWSLWWAAPDAPHSVAIALTAFVIATIGAEFATVFTNAMMPTLAPPERLGRLSGTGWAVGYLGGLVSLVVVLVFLAADPQSGLTIAGLEPAFGLDPETGQGDRVTGPLTAIWYIVFVIPLFLFVPDVRARAAIGDAVRTGLGELKETVRGLLSYRDMLLYLLAHMAYIDGLVALFAFGGIYAAGTFGWGTTEIGLFGILLTVTGAIGAFIGGRLDDWFGPKAVVMGALVVLLAAGAAILSVGENRYFFVFETEPANPEDGLFSTVPERIYLALGMMIGAVAGPLQAASRTLLARLAPAGLMTQYYGLYALSGKVTSFMGPLLVGAVTAWFDSQRAGMAVLLLFFLAGMALLAPVRVPRR